MAMFPFSSNPVATFTSRGAVRRTVYNVKDYGAIGDGVADDTTAVSVAFTAAAGGGIIFFPPGTYLISSSITLLPNTTIQGSGQAATVITCPSGMSTPIFTIIMSVGSFLHDWRICDLTMDGASGAATRGIQIDSSASAAITYYDNMMERVTFQNFYVGVYHGANNANAGAMLNNTTASYCNFTNNSFGYVFTGSYCEWLDHCMFRNNSQCGLMTPGAFSAPAISGNNPGTGPASAVKVTNTDVQNTVVDYVNGTHNGIIVNSSNSLFEHIFISNVSQVAIGISCSESGLDNRISDLSIYGSGSGIILGGIDKNTGGTLDNFIMFSTGVKTNWSGYVSRQAPLDIMSGSWKINKGKTDNGLLGPVTIPPYTIYIGDSGPNNTGTLSFSDFTVDGSYSTALYHGSPFSQTFLRLLFTNCPGISPGGVLAVPGSNIVPLTVTQNDTTNNLGAFNVTNTGTGITSTMTATGSRIVYMGNSGSNTGVSTADNQYTAQAGNSTDIAAYVAFSSTHSGRAVVAQHLGTGTALRVFNDNGLGAGTGTGIDITHNGVTGTGQSVNRTGNSASTVTGITVATTNAGAGAANALAVTSGLVSLSDAVNIILGTSSGTKIGTSTSQKLGFYNATPIVQPTGDIATALQNLGLLASATIGAITGTATNDNAASGIVGEIISSVIASGSATGLTSATPKNVTSVSLTAGDWDVTGVIDYVLTGATTSDFKSGSSSTSATFGAQDTFANLPIITTLLSDTVGHMLPTTRFSLASTTTIYLVAQCNFSAGTTAAYGTLRARRMR